MQIYRNSLEHTLAMLERIDLLIRHHVWLIQQGQTADFNLQGLYISDQEVNESLARAIGLPMWCGGDLTHPRYFPALTMPVLGD